MDRLTRARLDIRRQEIVSLAIADALAKDRPVPLLATTRARAEAVVALGRRLWFFTRLTSKRLYDDTKAAVVDIAGVLDRQERILSRSPVRARATQNEALCRVQDLRKALFPQGTDFTRWPMDMQWSALVKLRDALETPEVAADIEAVGLSACVESLMEHILRYEHVVGRHAGGAGAGRADAQEAWSDAMQKLAAQVLLDYEDDPDTRDELLGPYEVHVEEQRAAERESRKARRREAERRSEAQEPRPAPSPQPQPQPQPAPSPQPQPQPSPQPQPPPSPRPSTSPSPQPSPPSRPRTPAAGSPQSVHALALGRYTDERWPRHAPSPSRSPPQRGSRRLHPRWAAAAS